MEKKAVKAEKKIAKKRGRPAKVKKEVKVEVEELIEEKQPIEKKCGTCRHGFQSVFENKVNCKRFPPLAMSGGEHMFPIIEKSNICGEWSEKDE